MNLNKRSVLLWVLLILMACGRTKKNEKIGKQFLPDPQKIAVFYHQISYPGLDRQNLPKPFGIAFYASLFQDVKITLRENESFRKISPLLAHLDTTVPLIMLRLTNNQLGKIADGECIDEMNQFANTIKTYGKPVYLAVGFEVNNLLFEIDPDIFVAGYQGFVNQMKKNHVQNVSYVWHVIALEPRWAKPVPLSHFYPGDRFVNWLGLSMHNILPHHYPDGSFYQASSYDEVAAFAKEKNLPMMICESSTRSVEKNFKLVDIALWNDWYVPFFEFVQNNNVRIITHAFYTYDDAYIMEKWREKIKNTLFMHGDKSIPKILTE